MAPSPAVVPVLVTQAVSVAAGPEDDTSASEAMAV